MYIQHKKKLIYALCFVFLFVSLFSVPSQLLADTNELTIRDIVRLYDNSVVVIEVYDRYNDLIAFGSGFAIDKGLFVTNNHVMDVDRAYAYKVYTYSGKSYDVEGVVKMDAARDIAIIKTKEEVDLPITKQGSYKNLVKGDKIIAIGSPEGLQNTVSEGIVSGIRYLPEDDLNIIQLTAPITHGSSGGPVFNMYGEVVGIATAGVEGSGNLNFAVAIDHLAGWISELKAMQFSDIKVIKSPSNIPVPTPTRPGTGTQPSNPPAAKPQPQAIVIKDVKVSPIGENTATISWTTNTPVKAIVHYGKTTQYDTAVTVSTALGYNHSVTLTNLIPNTAYNFKIISSDYYEKQQVSTNFTFKTNAVKPVNAASIIRTSYIKFKVPLEGSQYNTGSTIGMAYKWKLTSKPQLSKSTVLVDNMLKPYFIPDLAGDYKLSLTINNGIKDIATKEIVYTVKALNNAQDTFDAKLIDGKASNFVTGYDFKDMITLTDGWVIIGDTNKNKVVITNLLTGEIGKEYQLSSAPDRFDLDFETGIIIATQSATNKVAKINMNTDAVTYLNMPDKVTEVVMGEKNIAFTFSPVWPKGQVGIIDLNQDKVLKFLGVMEDSIGFMVYDKGGNSLILGVKGMSPSSLYRLTYDEYNVQLSEAQKLFMGGYNGQSLAISNDGKHIAFSCGGGNGNGYSIYDTDSSDITSTTGEWKTGAYPRFADFSYDNKYLASTNGESILIFDIATHVLLKTIPIKESRFDLSNSQFSRGGKLVYGYTRGKLYFFRTGF